MDFSDDTALRWEWKMESFWIEALGTPTWVYGFVCGLALAGLLMLRDHYREFVRKDLEDARRREND